MGIMKKEHLMSDHQVVVNASVYPVVVDIIPVDNNSQQLLEQEFTPIGTLVLIALSGLLLAVTIRSING